MPQQFNTNNYHQLCDELALRDADLATVIHLYGYPPYWSRPNTFESLVHIILEQQVSLASALSALNKLRDRLGEVTPARILLLTDAEMRECYCSRQKTTYLRYLAEAILAGTINLNAFEEMNDEDIRAQLTVLKGIGNWTVDVYLMFVLHHTDILPLGDLAIVNAIKKLKSLLKDTPREQLLLIADDWKPYRTIASMLLWHFYLSVRKK
ncbi:MULTISPECIES: DNA-3-methyladenine glycosylase family protein [unclassified Mucilaginibacter]|uniref:DNA-3-methyladenine glycosylase family protein n=1 Tax=unclassified Mucilaginibacter TaxID=2617802 RepID=UPI00095B7918|nr:MULTISPECIES: DNA-3-methyladenine glycosylase 2 family protein [unclassified Mucilaginibacter]OJW17456.1 MAG: 3-methyladenine DNA glycosylase [Mucilaginibacter sp. 44-25]PLW91295.1 MAG: DNA-3-methyladenine glycosylase 2 family protein [Mucilaginibacter sp.]HEK21935.1 DNA-3-methyladenine glycosylase 2 family protein [Bacteroidota bacterium]